MTKDEEAKHRTKENVLANISHWSYTRDRMLTDNVARTGEVTVEYVESRIAYWTGQLLELSQ